MASSTGVGARWRGRCVRWAVLGLAAADTLVGDVGLLPVAGGNVLQALLLAGM